MKTNLGNVKDYALSKEAMSQIYGGGGRWVLREDGRMIWISK